MISSGRKRATSIDSPSPVTSGEIASSEALVILGAFANPWRLETYRLLVRYLPYGLAAGDIARLIALPHNTLSSHLATLEQAGLVRSRREGRLIIFAAVKERALRLAAFLSDDGRSATGVDGVLSQPSYSDPFPARREDASAGRIFNVLVLCTGNSTRSIMAEGILNREGQGRFRAYSAGSHPMPHPDARCLALLEKLGYDIQGLFSKSWTEFAHRDAPKMDVVVTVCDLAAQETQPRWPGRPIAAHWGIPDPATVARTDAQRRAALVDSYRHVAARISSLVNLDIEGTDRATLKSHLAAIGAMEGATAMSLQINAR